MWVKIFNMVIQKQHLTTTGMKTIQQLTHKINIENSINKRIGHSLKKMKI